MNTNYERIPSRNGIGSGLHIGHRPEQPKQPVEQTETKKSDKVETQRPNNPAPSRRGYA